MVIYTKNLLEEGFENHTEEEYKKQLENIVIGAGEKIMVIVRYVLRIEKNMRIKDEEEIK